MSCAATLRRTGGSITLSIPKSIAQALAVDAGSVVELVVEGRTLSVTPARRSLADRLAASPKSPAHWHRDMASLEDHPIAGSAVASDPHGSRVRRSGVSK
jgi:antitoxin ChpS